MQTLALALLPPARDAGGMAKAPCQDRERADAEAANMTTEIDYDQVATEYAQHRCIHPEVLRQLVHGLGPASKVLEVGCGTGNYLVAIRERIGCPCWGIDPSAEMLAQGAARSGQVQLSHGKAEDLDFPAGYFDLVFSADVIHHVGNRTRYIQEAIRVLRSGGRICTVTDSEWIIRHRQPLAVYFPETVNVDLARYPRINDLRSIMQDVGFVECEELTVEFACELSNIEPFRARVYSCLRLIPDGAFQRGMARMEQDILSGSIHCVMRYSVVWGSRPSHG
jgi:SAM-dependent methyltransferase